MVATTTPVSHANGYVRLPVQVQPLPALPLPMPSTANYIGKPDHTATTRSAPPPQPQTLVTLLDADILVRLVGRLHARHALRYFLTYMLSVSLVILLSLWLLRACPTRKRHSLSKRLAATAPASSAPLCCDIDHLVRAGRAPGEFAAHSTRANLTPPNEL